MKYFFLFLSFTFGFSCAIMAQDELIIGGNLSGNVNFFMADSAIGAINTPQYDHQLYGSEAWMTLNAAFKGFEGGIRFDMYNNSNLIDPKGSYSAQKIGRWFLRKQIHKLNVEAGYLYDQIGSGLIYRAYEERTLAIDNALYGVKLSYDLSPDWRVTGFTGKQKNRFDTYPATLRGGTLTGFVRLDSMGKFSLSPGLGIVSRTLADETMDRIVAAIATYTPADSVVPFYNTHALTLFNTFSAGRFTWYAEAAFKSPDIMFDPLAEKTNWTGTQSLGKLVVRPGNVLYSSLAYNQKGLGATLEFKRTENFNFRVNPFVTLNRGTINFLPPMARSNTYTLTAFYSAVTQEFGEQGAQLDIKYAPSRKLLFGLNLSNITDLKNTQLYQELYADVTVKHKRKWKLTTGTQFQTYNLERYYNEPGSGIMNTMTPFMEFLYKLSRKKSIRTELQYQHVVPKEHGEIPSYGDWVLALVEYNIAPHWSFTVSDMVNVVPGESSTINPKTGRREVTHYPRADVYYTHGSTRLSLSYVKQVEGVVCTGGVCRLEPAFSGVKMTVNTSF